MPIETIIFLSLSSAILSAIVAASKNQSAVGWGVLGLVFGPLGLLGAVGLPDDRPRA